jgi:hypothetical protein
LANAWQTLALPPATMGTIKNTATKITTIPAIAFIKTSPVSDAGSFHTGSISIRYEKRNAAHYL